MSATDRVPGQEGGEVLQHEGAGLAADPPVLPVLLPHVGRAHHHVPVHAKQRGERL